MLLSYLFNIITIYNVIYNWHKGSYEKIITNLFDSYPYAKNKITAIVVVVILF